ncbi:hypothetical protein M427DRAFT_317100 [Gonapodya prolifera JEL478]|uniref:FCH-domain-containing protein n=1 Tax=Gonapodya prolifera (strain JEL478) TaxID=1344416 RepID=A0A139AXN3_GONPJ|nr:hypothetical protein M427DRAFT_317100 [Gonapodya prolifera JEL478]|eukprot:KXS21333.1 hypothetical protein M427DRAFT_317100 [Gonapodya prolifera JEL478]
MNAKEFHQFTKSLRTNQQQQWQRIGAKSEEDIGTLENIRDYMKRRAEIEQDYQAKLERLSKSFASKRRVLSALVPRSVSNPGSGGGASDANGSDGVAKDGTKEGTRLPQHAFSIFLSESEKQAQFRGRLAEKLSNEIVDVIKEYNRERTAVSKKQLEYGQRLQIELTKCYTELEQVKLRYEQAAKDADSAKAKYDLESTRNATAFTALRNMVKQTDQEQLVAKLKQKLKAANRALLDSRNDYLLALQATNMQQQQYYSMDLPSLMKRIDGRYYTMLVDLLSKYATMETEYSALLKGSMEALQTTLSHVDRDSDSNLFLTQNADAFREPSQFEFGNAGSDEIRDITVDEFSKIVLSQKLGLYHQRNQDVLSQLQKVEKTIAGLAQMVTAYNKTPEFGNASSPADEKADLEFQLHILSNEKLRLDALMKRLTDKKVEMPKIVAPSVQMPSSNSAVALYDYVSKVEGELTIHENDRLTLLEPEKDGWIKAQKGSQIGLVPANYVKGPSPSADPQSKNGSLSPSSELGSNCVKAVYDHVASDETELSFVAGDIIEVTEKPTDGEQNLQWWEGKVQRTGQIGQFPVIFTQGWDSMVPQLSRRLRTASIISTNSINVKKQTTVRAKFDYDATCDGELTLKAGDQVVVTNKATGSDAWWEGRAPNGKIGQFPRAYVEEVQESPVTLRRTAEPVLPKPASLSLRKGRLPNMFFPIYCLSLVIISISSQSTL